jgi:hypothetical protein
MCDPFTAVVGLFCWMHFLRKLHHRAQEWPKYEQALKDTAALLSALERDHRRLMDTQIGLEVAGLGPDIASGKDILEDARKVVGWEKQASSEPLRSVAFAFNYKTAQVNQQRLQTCLGSLRDRRKQIDQLQQTLEERHADLRKKRKAVYAALARQYLQAGMEPDADPAMDSA